MPTAATSTVWIVRSSTDAEGQAFMTVAAFTNRRQAETLLSERKKVDPYSAQYDEIECVRAYQSIKRWRAAVRQHDKYKTRKP